MKFKIPTLQLKAGPALPLRLLETLVRLHNIAHRLFSFFSLLWQASGPDDMRRAAQDLLKFVKQPVPSQAGPVTMRVPVVALNEIRGVGTSITFLIHVSTPDSALMERSIQSILRQTEPFWEVLIVAERDAQSLVDEWLDVDWRIRRVPEPVKCLNGLLRALAYATSDFVCIVAQGAAMADDLVAALSQRVHLEPHAFAIRSGLESFETKPGSTSMLLAEWSSEFSNGTGASHWLAIRKDRLLNAVVPKT